MTTKILTGTYIAGYTLSASYTGLSITATGVVGGVNPSSLGYGGGIGVLVTFAAPVANAGTLAGGAGAQGYPGSKMFAPSSGGDGGIAADLTAGGSLYNSNMITGGSGGMGGAAYHAARGGYGGDGVRLGASGSVTNIARITGGRGGAGGAGTYGGNGGRGGAGIDMAAGGHVTNSSTVVGGAGGGGYSSSHPGSGGAGGAGIEMSGPGTVTNNALIGGGYGGGYGGSGGVRGHAGVSGAGVALNNGGTLINMGGIYGGGGYPAGYGGAGAVLAAGGSIINQGQIRGGHADNDGRGGDGIDLIAGGTVTNSHLILGGSADGASGKGGVGVSFTAGGSMHNTGTIEGGQGGDGVDLGPGARITNGGVSNKTALIYGVYGVSAGATGAATVANYGAIRGLNDSVKFQSAKDRLIVEPSGVFIGTVVGGGGTLEFAGGGETVTNLGAAGSMGGSLSLYFNDFGAYQIDSAASWTFLGGNVLDSGDILIDKGAMSLPVGASLSVANTGMVQIQGTVANSGALTLASTGGNTDLRVLSAGATLSGGGQVILSGPKARILGTSTAATLINADNTIGGTGYIGMGSMTLVNKFVIQANVPGVLTVNTKGSVLVNDDIMSALGPGTLVVASTTIDQTGGGVIACGGGTINLQGDVVIGGELFEDSASPGVFRLTGAGGELKGPVGHVVTVNGLVQVVGGVTLTLDGSISNYGKVSVGGASATRLTVGGDGVTLFGTGQINMSANAGNIIVGAAAGDTLTNLGNRIAGAGDIGGGSMKLVNQAAGAIVGNQTVALTINTGANTIVNAGLIENVGKGGTVIDSAVANTGTLLAATAGTLTLAGAVTGAGVGRINGGTLYAKAAFNENVTFSGSTGVLALAHSTTYAGKVTGLSKTGTNSLDLMDITFTSGVTKASYSGTTGSGVLTVTDGSHTAKISLIGDYLGSTFTVSSDGAGGTKVVDPTLPASAHPLAPVHPFIAAMADFSSGAAPITLAPEPWRRAVATLSAPKVHPG